MSLYELFTAKAIQMVAYSGSHFGLSMDPLIDGISSGFDVLVDLILELLPIVIVLGILGIFLGLFYFKKSRG